MAAEVKYDLSSRPGMLYWFSMQRLTVLGQSTRCLNGERASVRIFVSFVGWLPILPIIASIVTGV